MPAELIVCLRAPNGHAISVPPRRVTVGESPGCDIPIHAGFGLAAVHFRLQPWENGHFIEDAGSGLGLLINGVAVTWAPLKHGDRITVGELTFVYERGDAVLPSFPASLESHGEWTGAGLPAAIPAQQESPPSWLPREALLPPAPPPVWQPAAERKRGGTAWKWLLILILLAAAAGAWMVAAKPE